MIENEGIPPYYQIYKILKQKVLSEQWRFNSKLPSEAVMAKSYGVARGTMRRAILMLVDEGYLIRKRGIGTLVLRNQVEKQGELLLFFGKNILQKGPEAKLKLLGRDYIPSDVKLSESLGIRQNYSILNVQRLYIVSEIPVAFEEAFVNPDAITIKKGYEEIDFLYEMITGEKGSLDGRVAQVVKTIKTDDTLAGVLSLNIDQPVTVIDSLVYSKTDRPIARLMFTYRSDLYSAKLRLVNR